MIFRTVFAAVILVLLQACASSLEGDVYSRDEALRSMNFQWATIEAVKPVVIEGDRTNKGALAGGLIGGAAGHTVTNSSTQPLVTAVGAVAGAIAGQMAEEKMTRAQGAEISLKMDNGEHIIIVQEVESVNEFGVGDRVKVVSGSGKLRVAK
jgi:outer membrane lipoprotein SlyB